MVCAQLIDQSKSIGILTDQTEKRITIQNLFHRWKIQFIHHTHIDLSIIMSGFDAVHFQVFVRDIPLDIVRQSLQARFHRLFDLDLE